MILRSSEEPALNRSQVQRVMRSARAHAAYVKQRAAALAEDSDDDWDEGPEDEDGWLFEDLGVLIRLYARLRDKEQMIELIFEVSELPCSFFSVPLEKGLIDFSDGALPGNDFRSATGHPHHFLLAARSSLQGCEYRRLSGRFPEFHQRSDQNG